VPNAEPHPLEIGADMLVDRAQAIVPGNAAALLYLHLERRKVDFVVEHGERIGAKLVKTQRLAHRAARSRS